LLLVGPCLRAAAVAFAIETAGRVIFGLEPIGASSASPVNSADDGMVSKLGMLAAKSLPRA